MSELEPSVFQAGCEVFGPELGMIQAAADAHVGSAEEMIGYLTNRALGLGQEHPYFGRRLELEIEDPFTMEQYAEDGSHIFVPMEPGKYELDFAGMGMIYDHSEDDSIVYPSLALLLQVEGMEDCVAMVDPELIKHVDLAERTNPFAYDVKSLYDVDDNFDGFKLLYPTGDYSEYLDDYVEGKLSRITDLVGAELELLFTDEVDILVCGHQDVPVWAEYDGDDDEVQIPDKSEAPDDPDQTRQHRGVIIGEFVSYSLEEDESDESPMLIATLRLSPDDPMLEEEPWIRYVSVPAEQVSWGRVRYSPRFN